MRRGLKVTRGDIQGPREYAPGAVLPRALLETFLIILLFSLHATGLPLTGPAVQQDQAML